MKSILLTVNSPAGAGALLLLCAACVGARGQTFDQLAMTPQMGWNSWNKFQGKVSEQLIRETADAMATNGMKDAGYNTSTLMIPGSPGSGMRTGISGQIRSVFPRASRRWPTTSIPRASSWASIRMSAPRPAPATPAASATRSRTPSPTHPGVWIISSTTGATPKGSMPRPPTRK